VPSREKPIGADEWLRRARSNLARARGPAGEDVLLEDLCFDAQQAAEKALKALLCGRGMDFPFIHDLGELVAVLARNGVAVPDTVRDAVSLTQYAVQTRYPGAYEPVSDEEWNEAVRLAAGVVNWVEGQLGPDVTPGK